VETSAGARVIAVSEVPMSADDLPERVTGYLRGAAEGLTSASGGALLAEAPITLAGKYVGRAFNARLDRSLLMRARIFLVGKRLYQVSVRGTETYVNGAEASAFLDSFMVTE
jgi:hypothetical protein